MKLDTAYVKRIAEATGFDPGATGKGDPSEATTHRIPQTSFPARTIGSEGRNSRKTFQINAKGSFSKLVGLWPSPNTWVDSQYFV